MTVPAASTCDAASAHEAMNRLIMGFVSTHLIGVDAAFGVADLLAGGPRPATELAALASVNPSALQRVLRPPTSDAGMPCSVTFS